MGRWPWPSGRVQTCRRCGVSTSSAGIPRRSAPGPECATGGRRATLVTRSGSCNSATSAQRGQSCASSDAWCMRCSSSPIQGRFSPIRYRSRNPCGDVAKQPAGPQTTDGVPRAVGRAPDRKLSAPGLRCGRHRRWPVRVVSDCAPARRRYSSEVLRRATRVLAPSHARRHDSALAATGYAHRRSEPGADDRSVRAGRGEETSLSFAPARRVHRIRLMVPDSRSARSRHARGRRR